MPGMPAIPSSAQQTSRKEALLSEPIVKPTPCPSCNWMVYVVAPTRGDFPTPIPGDITVCPGCQEILIYEEGMTLRKMTDKEEKALPPDELTELLRVKLYLATGRPS